MNNSKKDIYEAFNEFKNRFLDNKISIFSERVVFTKDNLDKGFVSNPDESDNTFNDKIRKQLGNSKETHELFAHAIWL